MVCNVAKCKYLFRVIEQKIERLNYCKKAFLKLNLESFSNFSGSDMPIF
jgi:hypothetical protein